MNYTIDKYRDFLFKDSIYEEVTFLNWEVSKNKEIYNYFKDKELSFVSLGFEPYRFNFKKYVASVRKFNNTLIVDLWRKCHHVGRMIILFHKSIEIDWNGENIFSSNNEIIHSFDLNFKYYDLYEAVIYTMLYKIMPEPQVRSFVPKKTETKVTRDSDSSINYTTSKWKVKGYTKCNGVHIDEHYCNRSKNLLKQKI